MSMSSKQQINAPRTMEEAFGEQYGTTSLDDADAPSLEEAVVTIISMVSCILIFICLLFGVI